MTEKKQFRKGDYTNCRYDICEIIDKDGEIICTVALKDADFIIKVLNENEQLKSANMEYEDALGRLEEENEELKQTIKCICKDYEESHGMDIRNAEWFTAW